MTHQSVELKVTQLFNGEVAGKRETLHSVGGSAREIGRQVAGICDRYSAGEGWGLSLAVASEEHAKAIGAYQNDSGEWLVPVGEAILSLEIDPSHTAG